MACMNTDIAYGTLDPQLPTKKELISFTGITQNAAGTAVLTGVTRGLSFFYPFTASTTLRQTHSGQSIFILSDAPQVFAEYTAKRNDEAITGLWNFNSYLPTTSITPTSSIQFTNKAYVDGVALVSAPVSDETTKGVVELATQIEMASSTILGSTLAPLVLQARYATSSPSVVCGLCAVITGNAGKIAQAFLNLTEPFTWTAHHIFSSLNAASASTTNATTTNFSITGITSSLLKTNSTGIVQAAVAGTDYENVPFAADGTVITTSGTATTTTTIVIPANTLFANKLMVLDFFTGSGAAGTDGKGYGIDIGSGSATTTLRDYSVSGVNAKTHGQLRLIVNSATAEMVVTSFNGDGGTFVSTVTALTLNTANKNYIAIRMNAVNPGDPGTATTKGYTAQVF